MLGLAFAILNVGVDRGERIGGVLTEKLVMDSLVCQSLTQSPVGWQ